MPLKHTTETFLVFLLGAVIALTGIAIATLPSLSEGGVRAWGIVLTVTLLYPIVLLPLFRRDRADHAFRLLHWFPFFMVVVWLLLQLIARQLPSAQGLTDAYTWGWTLPVVAIGFVLLAAFCLQVLRRWVPRLVLLALAFVPFAFVSVLNEQRFHWNDELMAALWVPSESTVATGSGSTRSEIAANVSSTNMNRSSDESEEAWRERLRAEERRRERIAQRLQNHEKEEDPFASSAVSVRSSATSVASAAATSASVRAVLSLSSLSSGTSSAAVASSSASSRAMVAAGSESSVLSGTGKELREARTQPGHLPQSGFGTSGIAVSLLAGYCSVLHKRATKRARMI